MTTANLDRPNPRIPLSREFQFVFAAILVGISLFGLLLYLLPSETAFYWAWVIREPRSAILIGAGYSGAIFYYLIALRGHDWLEVESGLGGLMVFVLTLLIATMPDWERFKPYHPMTFIWLAFYYGGPLAIPVFYRMQIAQFGNASPGGAKISQAWRTWLAVRGLIYFFIVLLGMLFAPIIATLWPWSIEPLEVRVFMGQIAAIAWQGGIAIQRDGLAWRRHRLGLVLSAAIGSLQLIGLLMLHTPYNLYSPLGAVLPLIFAEWVVTPLFMFSIYRRQI
jgi:hypothetical protein